jgi:thiosulfate/3-mercaptopyruvate sulfurtransferase
VQCGIGAPDRAGGRASQEHMMIVTSSPHLVETDWLEHHLNDPHLRIIDCTVFLPNYFEESAGDKVEVVSGRDAYQAGHIPGSAFVDLVGELTDPTNDRFMFPMPSADQVASVMSRLGVGADARVVLYDRMVNIWATRVWWMLRVFGFDNAAVLNGGWAKWSGEGRPVSTEPATYPRASFVAGLRPDLIATKDEVVAAIGDTSTCIVNALDPDEYAGRGPVRYGRPGHIPTSVNVSFLGVLNAATAYLPLEEIRKQFEAVAAFDRRRVITYCGGGIAASADAFLLTLLGAKNVAVYDGSLTEWAADPTLPLATGDAP